MTIATWPSTLPQAGTTTDTSGGPQPNAVVFQPQNGPPIYRKKSSSVARNRKIKLPPMTQAQYATFITFFEQTIAYGVLPFNFPDPFTSTVKRCKFVQNDPVYNEVTLGNGLFQIDFEVILY